MGMLSSIFKAGLVAGAVVYGQRLWDAQKLDKLEEDLHHLELELRADPALRGTLVANLTIRGKEILDDYRGNLFLAHTVAQLEQRFAIYLESVKEPVVPEDSTAAGE
jgi:hypothetical protein